MSYVDNAPLITAWDNRVQALKDRFATLTDGTTTNVVIEDTEANTLLSSMSLDTAQGAGVTLLTVESPELVSNEQAPGITIETPTLTLEPEEGSEEEGDQEEDHGTNEVTDEVTDEDTDEVTDEDAGDGADPEQEESPEDKIESDEDSEVATEETTEETTEEESKKWYEV